MKNFYSKIALILTAMGLTSLASTATANDYLRINREARSIERKANMLAEEVVHYTAMPQYRHLTNDLDEFIHLSQHITDLVRVSGNLRHIKSDVNELDRTFHHIEGLFDRMERQIARGRGIKYGNTAHVKRLLNGLEDCIHHMQEDIAILEVRTHRRNYERPTYYGSSGGYGGHVHGTYRREVYTRPVYSSRSLYYGNGCPNRGSGIGFSVGGGSSRIQIRF